MFSAGLREAAELGERVSLPGVDPVSGSGYLAHGEEWMLEYRDGVVGGLRAFLLSGNSCWSLAQEPRKISHQVKVHD